MTNVIISHDVDHLFGREHWFRDLIYPKMLVRTSLQLLKGDIVATEWLARNTSCFRKNRHHLIEQMEFDKAHGIKSTFFFGMNQGLGMSYKPFEAKEIMQKVYENGFSIGVHGIDYQDVSGILKEYNTFYDTMGFKPEGIRMHYVRYDEDTFNKLDSVGYIFDSTEFNKEECGTRKDPYKIGNMWEFPLTIMDGYLPQHLEDAKKKTMEILDECRGRNIGYISVLFHDFQLYDGYKDMRDWYVWLMELFCDSEEYTFVSHTEAIAQLEKKNERRIK